MMKRQLWIAAAVFFLLVAIGVRFVPESAPDPDQSHRGAGETEPLVPILSANAERNSASPSKDPLVRSEASGPRSDSTNPSSGGTLVARDVEPKRRFHGQRSAPPTRGGAIDLSPHGFNREALRRSDWSESEIAHLEATWERWAEDNEIPEVTRGEMPGDNPQDRLTTREVTEELCGALSGAQCDGLLYGLDLTNRVSFDGVEPGSKREALGISDGDVILTMNGQLIFSMRDFNWKAREYVAGPTELVVDRAGEQITIIVPVGERPSGRYRSVQVVPPADGS